METERKTPQRNAVPKSAATSKSLLTVDTIGDLNEGRVRLIANHCIKELVQDLEDRGGDLKARTLTISVEMKRVSSSPSEVEIDVKIDSKVPAFRTRPTDARVLLNKNTDSPEYGLFFQPNNSDNADQPTLMDEPQE